MAILTIAEIWETFEKLVLLPIKASDTQRNEMRKAFYAGAGAALQISLQIGKEIHDEEAGAQAFEKLNTEVINFALSLQLNHGERQS